MRFFICCLFFLIESVWAKTNDPHVVFINPGFASDNPTGNFWATVSNISKAAARDLDLKLTVLYADRDHIYMKSLVKRALKLKPDYLVLVNEKGVGPSLLKLTANSNAKVFFLLNDLSAEMQDTLTVSERKKVIGGVQPNNMEAGRLLAEALLGAANPENKKLKILALQGDHATQAAIDRRDGMFKALESTSVKYELIDSIVANWSKNQGFAIVNGFLERGIEIDRIWSANDAIAFGADIAVKRYKQESLVGGINWDIPPSKIDLYTSVGGHVTLGALALVKIRDYHDGQWTAPNHTIVNIFVSNESKSSQEFIRLIKQEKIHDIDFTRFSRSHDSPLKFTIENLVQTVK